MKTPDCAYWLGKLANLNAARTAGLGIAPHKPLMLLTLCDLIESGDIADRWIVYTPRLVTQFRGYWDLVIARRKNRPDITMPFNALGGERDAIWECYDINGNPSKSKLTTRLCHLNASLFECLCDPDFRREARRTLAAGYFTPTEQVGLCERLRIPLPDTAEIEELKKDIEHRETTQKIMKAANKIIKGGKATREEKILALLAIGISKDAAEKLFEKAFEYLWKLFLNTAKFLLKVVHFRKEIFQKGLYN